MSDIEDAEKAIKENVTQGAADIDHGVHQIEDGQDWQDTAAGVGNVLQGVEDVMLPGAAQAEHIAHEAVDAWNSHEGSGEDATAEGHDTQDADSYGSEADSGEASHEEASVEEVSEGGDSW